MAKAKKDNIFKRIADFFVTLYHTLTQSVPDDVRKYAETSLEITYKLKQILQSPVADVLTAIIPSTIDDNAKKQMITYIDKVLPYLIIVDDCKNKGDVSAMIACWVQHLAKHPAHTRNALLIKFAALLTAMQHGEEYKQSLYDAAVQLEYTASIKKANYETKYADKINGVDEES